MAEPPDRSRGGCAERPEGSDDLLRFWKPVFFLLREDEPAVGDDVEGPEAEQIAHALGATFGQTVATNLGGHWEVDPDEGLVLTEIGGVGLIMNPFQVAASRIAHGPSHAFEYHFAVYRDLARRLTASE